MKFSRPDVACSASRLHVRNPGITKAKWMEILNEDMGKQSRHYEKSVSLHEFSNLAHSTWSHFTYGDPVGSFKVDRGLYGDAEARRRHLARAQRSGERWRCRHSAQDPPSPLPEDASESWAPTPASSSREQKGYETAQNACRNQHPSSASRELNVPDISQNASPSGRAKVSSPASSSAQASTRQPPPPPTQIVLPQLWAVQPRIMTPHSPYAPSSKRSCSVTPTSVNSRFCDTSTRPPLRRVDSDPGSRIGMRVESDASGSRTGYIDPALRLGPSPTASMKSSKSGCRYTSTFTFG